MNFEYRYLSEIIKDRLKAELPEGGNGGYLHFGIDDEWVINYHEGILMNKISNYHDIEGGPYLEVFILIHNNEKYVARTFKYCDRTDRVYTRYIVTICGKKIDESNEEKQILFQNIKQALVFYDKMDDKDDKDKVGFQYEAYMMTDEISERMDYETSIYDKDELERHAKIAKLLNYKSEIKNAIKAVKEGENSYVQEDVNSMTDISDGYHAWYDEKDYIIFQKSLDSIIISSTDSLLLNKGFVRIDAQKFLYERVADKYIYYKVVYKDEVERMYYATYSASYGGLKCMIKRLPKETKKLEITPIEFPDENKLKELGFEKAKLGGNEKSIEIYKKLIGLDDPLVSFIRNEHKEPLTGSTSGIDRACQRLKKQEQVERIINILVDNYIYDRYGEKAVLGLFGYGIFCKELPTDIDVMVDVVFPSVYEKVLARAEERCYDVVKSNIIRGISRWVSNCDSGMSLRNEVWVDNQRNLLFYGYHQELAFYMKLRYYDLIFQRKQDKSYPFEFEFVNNEYWLNVALKTWSNYHAPLWYNGSILCDDFAEWVKKIYKKFETEYGMNFEDLK